MSFLPRSKRTWAALLGISLLCTSIVSGFLIFSKVYKAYGISEPTTITITTTSDVVPTIEINRVSRGGAQFAIQKVSSSTWTTTEWVRELVITYGPQTSTNSTQLHVAVGKTTYTIELASLPIVTNSENNFSTTHITKNVLARNTTYTPFFEQILNWPGDATAFLRAFLLTFWPTLTCLLLTLLFSLGYRHLIVSYSEEAVSEETSYTYYPILIVVCTLILATVSLVQFLASGPTAYEWPALDMAPFLERAADPHFLPNDFFTNSSSQSNPRFIFGYLIIGLGKILSATWYETFFFLKVVLTIFLPPLIFVSLSSFFPPLLPKKRQLIATCGVFIFTLLALFPLAIDQFTIALWRPYTTMITPHSFAFIFGLVAVLLANKNKKKSSLLFWFTSTLIHPTVGISLFTFFVILRWQTTTLREYIIYTLAAVLVPGVLLTVLFAPAVSLSGAAFVYHYITSIHSIHYAPSSFETSPLSPLPWYFHFSFLTLLLLLSSVLGWWKKEAFLCISAGAAAVTYAGCVLLSYLCIELVPIKLVAAFGPSRYTLFGYWFLAIFISYTLTLLPHRYFAFLNVLKHVPVFSSRLVLTGLTVLSLIIVWGVYTHQLNDPISDWKEANKDLYAWLQSTPSNSVIAANITYFDFISNTPIVAHRAVFTGNGFPFREDDFVTFNHRRALLYGNPEDWKQLSGNSDLIKSSIFFRTLTPFDVLAISKQYQLDYVIIESTFSESFNAFIPVFANEKVKVFNVNDFQ